MKPNITRILLVFLVLLMTSKAYSEGSGKTYIGIALDEISCSNSKWNMSFIPVPAAVMIEEFNSTIDREFGKECLFNGLLLGGVITEETLPQLKFGLRLLELRRNKKIMPMNFLWLDSPGGLIFEAMKIGDVIAEKGMEVTFLKDGSCYSSCVFIYAAAESRFWFLEKIGVHRPFANEISAESMNYSEYLEQYNALTPILKEYLSKYGVSPALVDLMNVIPSDDIRILTEDELENYGLGLNNVAAKEYEKAKKIQACGEKYYELHVAFNDYIELCREKLILLDVDNDEVDCRSLAIKAFPEYFDEIKKCKGGVSLSDIIGAK